MGARGRPDDRRVWRVRPVGLPPGRHVAPHLRSGRDALGSHSSDADRWRLGHAGEPRPARRGGAAPGTRSGAPAGSGPRLLLRSSRSSSVACWWRCPPSRESSTSACRSSPGAPSGADHARRRHRAGRGAHLSRRGGALLAALGFLLIRGFRRGGRRGVRPDHAALPALPGRGAGRRRCSCARRAQSGGRGGARRRLDRHGRARRRVGLEPGVDADPGALRCFRRRRSPGWWWPWRRAHWAASWGPP